MSNYFDYYISFGLFVRYNDQNIGVFQVISKKHVFAAAHASTAWGRVLVIR